MHSNYNYAYEFKKKFFCLIAGIFIFFFTIEKPTNKLSIPDIKHNKYNIKKFHDDKRKSINQKTSINFKREKTEGYIIIKSSEKEYLTAYGQMNNSTFGFHLNENQNQILNNLTNLKIDINSSISLNFYGKYNLSSNILYKSNHPNIIEVNNKGIISAKRPGKAIIEISGLNNKIIKINALSIPNNGLISNITLKINKAEQFNNIMIVAHPDDETLWGGANLYKDKFFIVCLTNGYNFRRSNDFRKLLNFTKNRGVILDYPDMQDSIIDNWSEVKNGIIKDLSTILGYKHWNKIVTHGPDGTTGHYHHKKTCEYVTMITRKLKLFNNLYYFGKFYKRGKIPNNLTRITKKELEYKMKEISLYISVKNQIHKFWIHMVPYENWILASKWKKESKEQS